MANLVELSNDLEFVPKEQLIQMSQDPNSTFPPYLVLAEIQRRTQMEKMYDAQQPKPQTSVAEELVAEFAGSPSGLGAMAQSSDLQQAFPSGDMSNMAPPSPMQMMASGGRTGYQAGSLTSQTIAEANALGIDITNLSDEEIIRQINLSNEKRRKDMLLGMTPNLNESPITQPLPTSPEDLLNLPPIPAGIQAQIDEAKKPSRFDEFIEGGTQFFFGDPRPDARFPTLARATDEPTDFLSLIPGAVGGLKLGASGLKALIQKGKAFKQSDKLDDIIDFSKVKPQINQADNILPPVPRTGGTPPTSGPTVGPIRPSGTSLVPQTGTSLVPQGGPLAVIPKVTKESKGLINRAIDFLKNNKTAAGILGIGGITTAYSLMDDADINTDDTGDDDSGPKTKEIKRVMDPLDLAKLGGIIMGARNTSELGQGITALAGDIQERRYKEKVLDSKQAQELINRLNAITKAIENADTTSPEYANLVQAQNATIEQINALYGIQGTDFAELLDSVTVKKKVKSDTESKGIGGALKDTFFKLNPLLDVGSKLLQNKKNNQLTPNPNDEGYASKEFLTGDPFIDNIIRIESSGRDVVNSTTGATGPMQVLPSTLQNPGYNIEPAKNDSVEEKIRVGEEYFYAMVDKYNGDILLGTLAYNLGPGNVDTWLNSGGDINTLKSIMSKDGRPIGNDAYNYVVKAYGQDAVNRRLT